MIMEHNNFITPYVSVMCIIYVVVIVNVHMHVYNIYVSVIIIAED